MFVFRLLPKGIVDYAQVREAFRLDLYEFLGEALEGGRIVDLVVLVELVE